MRASLFGFGSFGRLMTRYLTEHFDEFLVYDRTGAKTAAIQALGAVPATLEEAAAADVVILAVPLEALESTLQNIAPHLRPSALVVDTTSVKVKPVELMQRLLPDHVQILATHPLFGPESAAHALDGHKIVVDPVRVEDVAPIEEFLRQLGLTIIHMTADEHDREMAWVHALTFFVGRGLLTMNPPQSNLGTNYYNKLMAVVDLERHHSYDLFLTIQRGNPYADEMRKKLIASLAELEKDIEPERG